MKTWKKVYVTKKKRDLTKKESLTAAEGENHFSLCVCVTRLKLNGHEKGLTSLNEI